jgi:hypothetical protein
VPLVCVCIDLDRRFCDKLMVSMNIPKEVVSGLKLVAALDGTTRSRITEVLRSESASLDPSEIAATLCAKVKDLDREPAREIIDCLIALELARTSANVSVQRLSTDVVLAAGLSPDEEANTVSTWLQETLGVEPLIISAKGISVMQDNERTFLNARIITDVRPVYREPLSETPSEPPSAAVIVHSLKISFREAGRYREFFTILDNDDLVKLKQTLERAEAKTRTLSAFLQSAKISYLEVQSSRDDD